MSVAWSVLKRTGRSFYDDQMTHHAAALTYYGLMSLFPATLLGLSLLGLLGEYPRTYNAIADYLRGRIPESTFAVVDRSLREAMASKGTAATAFGLALLTTLYGTTGALEATRRALNVVFEVEAGRSFLRRKAVDIASTLLLMALILVTLVLVFVGGGLAKELFGLLGLGSTASSVWNVARWPAALAVAILVFALLYYLTPDVRHRGLRSLIPGAVVGVLIWLLASAGFSAYVTNFASVNAVYGAFAGAILLVAWIWLTNVALLFGAELNAEIERQRELAEGVPAAQTLALPAKRG